MAENLALEAAGPRPWRQSRVLGSTTVLGRHSRYGSKEGVGNCRYSRSQEAQPASPGTA